MFLFLPKSKCRSYKALVEFYRKLGSLRSDEIFADSNVENVFFQNGVFAFDRIKNGKGYKIFVNAGKNPYPVGKDCNIFMGKLDDDGCLPPLEYVILYTK